MIIATAEVAASPERTFRVLTTNEVERWWGHPDFYHQTGWTADLCAHLLNGCDYTKISCAPVSLTVRDHFSFESARAAQGI
jgi:hypothetical protein